jgi:hypothetical protein
MFLSAGDLIFVRFGGIKFYGFIVDVKQRSHILVWVGFTQSSKQDFIILEVSDKDQMVFKLDIPFYAFWDVDIDFCLETTQKGYLSDFRLIQGSISHPLDDLFIRGQLSAKHLNLFFFNHDD